MLNASFIHIPGVGAKTEQRIWGAGIRSWRDFLANPSAAGMSSAATKRIAQAAEESLLRLEQSDHRFFASRLARREHWRAYPEFADRIAYLDIETTSLDGNDVTIIGLSDGRDVRVYQKGRDLEQFRGDIDQYGLIVTFFGSCFDVPFLCRRFPGLEFDHLHIDLCHAMRRLGLTGGLKNIERHLGICRAPETEGLDGWDAVRLWREWERGSQEALDLLLAYNKEDVRNMQLLLEYAYPRLREKAGFPHL
jgi:hypothetical protein